MLSIGLMLMYLSARKHSVNHWITRQSASLSTKGQCNVVCSFEILHCFWWQTWLWGLNSSAVMFLCWIYVLIALPGNITCIVGWCNMFIKRLAASPDLAYDYVMSSKCASLLHIQQSASICNVQGSLGGAKLLRYTASNFCNIRVSWIQRGKLAWPACQDASFSDIFGVSVSRSWVPGSPRFCRR